MANKVRTTYLIKAFRFEHIPGGRNLAGESQGDDINGRPKANESTKRVSEQAMESPTSNEV